MCSQKGIRDSCRTLCMYNKVYAQWRLYLLPGSMGLDRLVVGERSM